MIVAMFFGMILCEEMADKEKQEAVLKASGACYTMVQPIALTDKPGTGSWTVSEDGSFKSSKVSRADLASYIVSLLAHDAHKGASVTFSG